MSLTATINFALSVSQALSHDLSSTRDSAALSCADSLTTGVGADQANRVFADTRTFTYGGTVTEDIDVFDFDSAVDALGNTFALSKVRLVVIKNNGTTEASVMTVGNKTTAAAWQSPFNASDTGAVTVGPGGYLVLFNPSLAGYAVADTTNHILTIASAIAATGSHTYDIVVIGSQA